MTYVYRVIHVWDVHILNTPPSCIVHFRWTCYDSKALRSRRFACCKDLPQSLHVLFTRVFVHRLCTQISYVLFCSNCDNLQFVLSNSFLYPQVSRLYMSQFSQSSSACCSSRRRRITCNDQAHFQSPIAIKRLYAKSKLLSGRALMKF